MQVGERLFEQCKALVNALIDKLLYELGTGHLLNTDYLSGALCARYTESVVEYLEHARDEIAVLNERIGTFYYRTTGQLQKALSFFEKYRQLREALYEANPDHANVKNGLAISYFKLGEFYRD